MTLNRREAILLAAAAAAPLPAVAADSEDSRLSGLFDTFFAEDLQQNPERATLLGFDKGANAPLKAKLTDESLAAVAERKARTADQLARLTRINRAALSEPRKVDYDTVAYTLRSQGRLMAFDFGGSGSPYVISQNTGSYQSTPDFLDTKHAIVTDADAEAYLSRLSGYGDQLDQESERFRHDTGLGVVPPDFILDTVLVQLDAQRKPAEDATLVKSIRNRAAAKGLASRYGDEAAKIWAGKVMPALDRQRAVVERAKSHAVHAAGIGGRPQGQAWYAAALQAATTTNLTPAEVHKLGLDQAVQIEARLDGLLKAQGLTKGTVGERIAALYKDPASFFPNTDAGKADAIAYCNGRLAAIRPHLPNDFKRLPPYAFEVRRVPTEIEAGAASAYSQGPALDGSRPGIVYINLRDTAEWPRWSLSSVIFHEGLPGHQLEGGLALSNKSLPLIRKTIGFSGYAEGWALYAEQLADEMGMYDHDPLSRIGYLKFQLFRAGRCVADTGLNHLGWSREKAVSYFEALDADAPGFATREVDRYCTTAGQGCSYKIGHTVFVRARARAKAALGSRFDIRDFHAAGLDCGRVPLDVLDGVIDRWIASQKRV
ncbi:MAG TPA: DUF885 family protein [Caulobacteraceae bacterium]|jgi:uncharacterized protein (DUF885 family)|nr:DUF885 family protein [Caulobacteraceae bacterium]